jgi:predicted metal-dependent hydrolase
MSLLPHYKHIINPKLKHIYFSFDDQGNLIVKSPKITLKQLEKLLLKKASWISNAQKKITEKKGKHIDFSPNSELYYLGKAYRIQLKQHDKKRSKLTFDSTSFTLHYYQYDEIAFQKQINRFYKDKAQAYLPKYVETWAQKMQVTYGKLSFRKTKRQWGSCSAKNDLSFNTMLMKLPENVIQYIIVHELSHIKHKHHQKAFWDHVAHYMPNYKEEIATLKTYTT